MFHVIMRVPFLPNTAYYGVRLAAAKAPGRGCGSGTKIAAVGAGVMLQPIPFVFRIVSGSSCCELRFHSEARLARANGPAAARRKGCKHCTHERARACVSGRPRGDLREAIVSGWMSRATGRSPPL